jgi:superfamily II DNA helicase RecQ
MINEVREFIKDKEVISVTDYHFIKNDVPYLTFVFRYFPHRAEIESKHAPKEKRDQDEDWKKLLTEADMGLFNILRDWRSQRCKKEGVPPYILFTNQAIGNDCKKETSVNFLNLRKLMGSEKVKRKNMAKKFCRFQK